uniref:Uncharacterized protein n=1 Tax=Strigamia maritima TaxID=126957 RepID=T1J241_STRMM
MISLLLQAALEIQSYPVSDDNPGSVLGYSGNYYLAYDIGHTTALQMQCGSVLVRVLSLPSNLSRQFSFQDIYHEI